MSAVGSILTNQGALDALQSISMTSAENNTLENEMSTGLAISSPSDNPAGYITAQGFTSQINGLTQATSNANQGVSLLQTAQGALQQQIGIVQQLNSTAVQAANGTETSSEATSLQSVVSQLTSQVSSIASQTQFNNVNLLNGTFNNVQFQVGANEGQTMSLSMGNTAASALGMYQTNATGGVLSTATTAGSLTAGTNGKAAGVQITVGGTNLGSVPLSNNNALESAATLASSVNSMDGAKGVTASASNVANLGTVTSAVGSGTGVTLTLAASGSGKTIGTSYQATGTSTTSLAASINKGTADTGISATVNSSGSLILTQATGQNIQLSGYAGGGTGTGGTGTGAVLTGSANGAEGAAVAAGATGSVTAGGVVSIQGSVQLAAGSQLSVTSTSTMVSATSSFYSLAGVNVSTVNGATPSTTGTDYGTGNSNVASYAQALNTQGGANQAISVVNFALDSLNNTGGQLGAVQQGLTANINNLSTTSENATTALGTVEDANLPQVANQLTQAQIQAQAGVAALKSSTTLQQSYLSLLP